jgi:L,D-transpeptidase ErfK/SrfK
MYPEDIETLFDKVSVGTQVQLVNQPIKLGWLAGSLFLELHPPLEEDKDKYQDFMQSVLDAISDFLANNENTGGVDSEGIGLSGSALRQAIEEQSGIPVLISR